MMDHMTALFQKMGDVRKRGTENRPPPFRGGRGARLRSSSEHTLDDDADSMVPTMQGRRQSRGRNRGGTDSRSSSTHPVQRKRLDYNPNLADVRTRGAENRPPPFRGGRGARVRSSSEHTLVDDGDSMAPTMQDRRQSLGRNRGGSDSRSSNIPSNRSKTWNETPQVDKKKKPRIIGLRILEELMTKEPRVVVLSLQDSSFGFKELLTLKSYGDGMLILIIKILTKASTCTSCPENLMALLNDVLSSDLFVLHVPKFLTDALRYVEKRNQLTAVLQDLAVLFNKFLLAFPCKAGEQLAIALEIVKGIVARQGQMGIGVDPKLRKDIEAIDERLEGIVQTYDARTREQKAKEESQVAQLPADDFRAMSVTPTIADVYEILEPFLRPNLDTGAFISLEHYLDVHFRLLREDFIAPLRDGLLHYRSLVSRGKLHELKNSHIKIYQNVYVTHPTCSPFDGICQELRFDVTRLKNVRWEATKRLLHGSLICLSNDNFADFDLAVIVKRDPKVLKDGVLTVRFVNSVEKAWDIKPDQCLTMIESPSYFEAYSPVLKALQTVTTDTLPFQEYLVAAKKDVAPPRYLLENTKYSITPLLTESFDKNRERQVRVLSPYEWPTREELSLDAAQFSALKAALTREIAIIQGPPGTGKTFLGLKIMEALLHNRDVWSNEGNPILVICYTNHALDQFLEGMLKFVPKDIVRVGGRSKCESLANFNLSYLRQAMRDERTIPVYVYHSRKTLGWDMKETERDIFELMRVIKGSESQIISEKVLEPYIQPHHFMQLEVYKRQLGNSKSALGDWLCLGYAKVGEGQEVDHNVDPTGTYDANIEIADEEQEGDEDDVLAQDEIDRRIVDDYQDDEFYNLLGRRRDVNSKLDEMFLTFEIPNEQEGEWQIQGGKKKIERMIHQEMRKTSMMSEMEERNVMYIHNLNFNDRWRLYRRWVFQITLARKQQVRRLLREYQDKFKQLNEVSQELDVAILQKAKVIGMTTTGAAKYQNILQMVAPKIVIVEEAAEVLESHITTALTKACEHLILIGDQQQLRPNPTVYKLAKDYKLDISLFERLIKNGLPYERLELQHRMKPNIAALLVPHIYPHLKNHPSVEKYEMIRGVDSNLFFINHENVESIAADSTSRTNSFEASFMISLCRYLILQGYNPSQITILSTYLGQLYLIKQKAKGTIVRDVRCTVVDNFQGEENDIILLSLVRSNEEGQAGFLKVDNRVCVALSRARMGLFCVGNFDFLSENTKVWKPVVDYVRQNGMIGKSLVLRCQNHPQLNAEVSCAKDFDKAPEGGCLLPCEFRLPCGHQCPKVCHPYDALHEETKCTKPCAKVLCELGHKCKKDCFRDCGPCVVPVPKLFDCGHTNTVPCHRSPQELRCRTICNKPLSCGHPCQSLCSDTCDESYCHFNIQVKSLCSHIVDIACRNKNNESIILSACKEPCNELLPCEHPCSGSCYKCFQGRLHKRCSKTCGRTLICGHACDVPCAQSCPPCTKLCENRCTHSKCPKVCGQPCKPCVEPCEWQCEHYTCTTLCSDFCDRPRCDEPCTNELPCGHPCIGLCGEECPSKCRICDKDEVCEIFFGDEDDPYARFIVLEDCKHIFEVNGMDTWMDQGSQSTPDGGDINVDMKCCPKCKTVIRKSLRYGNVIKRFLNDVIAIKERIFGKTPLLKYKTRLLQNKITSLSSEGGQNASALLKNLETTSSAQDLETYTTLYEFLKRLSELWDMANNLLSLDQKFGAMHISSKSRIKQLMRYHLSLDRHSSQKQLLDFSRELHRNTELIKILDRVKDHGINDRAYLVLARILGRLLDVKPYTDDMELKVRLDLEEFSKEYNGLGVSETEKIQIVNAMGMAKGHWFKCQNGHFYAIGECGGAMERGRCLECKAPIGGERHRLTEGNTLATEIDGTTQPAYPTF